MEKKVSDLVIENNHQFIIASKPAGMPVQEDKTGDSSLLGIMETYSKSKLHLISRLDRPVSGLVLLSKKSTAHKAFKEQHENNKIKKDYLAIVEGKMEGKQTLEGYLARDGSRMKAFISDTPKKDFEKVSLNVESLKILDNYTILKISLTTGKFHQIRAQLAHAGHFIKGDVKYGARRKNKDRSIYLHSHQLSFVHPVTKKEISFKADPDSSDTLWSLVDTSN